MNLQRIDIICLSVSFKIIIKKIFLKIYRLINYAKDSILKLLVCIASQYFPTIQEP
jgi:hypothetical protein